MEQPSQEIATLTYITNVKIPHGQIMGPTSGRSLFWAQFEISSLGTTHWQPFGYLKSSRTTWCHYIERGKMGGVSQVLLAFIFQKKGKKKKKILISLFACTESKRKGTKCDMRITVTWILSLFLQCLCFRFETFERSICSCLVVW